MVAVMRYAGSILGSLCGTQLYEYSVGMQSGPGLLRGGSLPTLLFGTLAMANVAALASCVRRGEHKAGREVEKDMSGEEDIDT